ncbi:unnamed protein product [Linum trigynum]|uniref:AT-hook motif nuclear-localized protein n=1 Tax=Linum trigynum TaxID=586398 RepID=A0AAV2CWZ9_9ROSI
MSVPGGNSSAPMSAPGSNSSAPMSAQGEKSSAPMSAPGSNSSAPMPAQSEKSSAPGGKSSASLSLAVNSATNKIYQILTSTRIFGCELRFQSNSSKIQKSPGEKSWAPGAVGKSSAPLSSAPTLRVGIFDAISQVAFRCSWFSF